MIEFKGDNLYDELASRGYTYTWFRKTKILSQATLTRIKRGDVQSLNLETLSRICTLLHKQPGDLLKNVVTEEEKKQFQEAMSAAIKI